MVDGDLFDKLAQIARIIRKSVEPFGGIQVDRQDLFWYFGELLTLSSIGYRNGRFLPATASDEGLQSSEICL